MRYYQWGLQIKKGAGQGEPGPELTGRSDISARSRDRQMARKTSREGVSQDLGPEGHPPRPPPVPLPRTRNLRLCDSRCRWDRGKTNSVSGCKMSSKNFCRSRRRSCWRSRAARGFGSMLAPGRTSTALKLRGDPMGAWAWGAQPEASRQGALDCCLDTSKVYLLLFPETKSITTNFKSHTEAGLTLAPQRGCQFQAQQKRRLCIQGTQPMAKSQSRGP